MITIDEINFAGKKALIRVDFNVPLNEKLEVTDSTRIRAAIPTIKKVLNDGGSVILMSHLGRPKGGPEEKYSLKHITKTVSDFIGQTILFASDCIGEAAQREAVKLKNGKVLLLENLRFHKEEEKGNEEFARALASLGDVYVNDAFGTAHRAHASTAIIAKYFPGKKCFGYLMSKELKSIDQVLHNASRPFTAIIGGAKVSDKILIMEQLIHKANNIIIGGGMAFTFAKAMGGKIGKSLVEEDSLTVAREILNKAKEKGVHVYLPTDAICSEQFSNEGTVQTCLIHSIPENLMGLDIGPASVQVFSEIILQSKTLLWNGPMGVFEMSKFETGTKTIAEAIVRATAMGAYSLIGGGDSVAAINKYKLGDKVSYISTGGGALLEYIESGTLPGIEAINN